ncbi:Ig-like domain-containing protein [Sphingobacterium sp. SRCM116780]|uniref:Ig-like domain-containing domain n=1 Tax=Sphingobacterium sp. SRCM116780 TaxID=2907623 RepID=UPI001F261425|nr:Ig-like domain-containing domain [Sphingobacterium sp. SRCM116780]UIR55749.1 Ig-like domain-containing protein [Sphingobacterium sp. SRCM116780]
MILDSKKHKSGLKGLKSTLFSKLMVLSFFSLLILLTIQCASIKQPTGGPKDSIAPKILNEFPANFSKNFKEKKISITLDEYIKLNNQQKEISISPDMDKLPQFKVKKKILEITLPDSLEKNTTYTINFGKGLVDYNASNPIINYSYVFATGNQIDSLSVSGNVKNALTKEPEKEVRVLLIPISQDSIFGKKKANIFAQTDSSGNYKINNLRANTYRIYALKEANNDRIYNNPDELIGFLKDSVVLDRDLSNINLQISKGPAVKFRVLEKKIENSGRIYLAFNRRVKDPNLTLLNDEDNNKTKIVKYSQANDSAYIYMNNLERDSIKFVLTENNTPLDTILIKKSNLKLDRTIAPIIVPSTGKVDRVKHLTLSSLTPIKSIDKSKVKFIEDSISKTNFQLQLDTTIGNLYHIRYNWRKEKNYQIVLEEGAMQGYFGEKNKEYKINLTYDDSDNYGDITFTFTDIDSTKQYLVELINEKKDKVFRKDILNTLTGKLIYKEFPGGKYSIRIIRDDNKNGIWDSGEVYKLTQPEPLVYLNKIFTIRANWEQNETFSLKELNELN